MAAVVGGNVLHIFDQGVGEIQTKVISLNGNFRDRYSCFSMLLKK